MSMHRVTAPLKIPLSVEEVSEERLLPGPQWVGTSEEHSAVDHQRRRVMWEHPDARVCSRGHVICHDGPRAKQASSRASRLPAFSLDRILP